MKDNNDTLIGDHGMLFRIDFNSDSQTIRQRKKFSMYVCKYTSCKRRYASR